MLTPVEEGAVEAGRGADAYSRERDRESRGAGTCHVHLCFVYWNSALWGRRSVGRGKAVPERLGGPLSPSPGQDMLVADSHTALLFLGPRPDCFLCPLPWAPAPPPGKHMFASLTLPVSLAPRFLSASQHPSPLLSCS